MVKLKNWTSKNLQGDPVIWIVVAILSIISVLVVYSAAGSLAYRNMEVVEVYLIKHGALIILSLFAMWIAHKIDYRYYSRISKLALWVSIPLLFVSNRDITLMRQHRHANHQDESLQSSTRHLI